MTVGVVLMTYGAPKDPADVAAYLGRVREGKTLSAELIEEMCSRYVRIGGSPLVAITCAQAAALERELGIGFHVRAGMRYSDPNVDTAVAELVDQGCDSVVGICLSPQWSSLLMGGYERALRSSIQAHAPATPFAIVEAWHRTPQFIDLLAANVRRALETVPTHTPVLLTAHSLPRRVFETEPGYIAQLRETAELVAARAGLRSDQWSWAYQSAGHTAEEWLRPDLKELFPALAAAGHRAVLIAPVQFLADHLEVLYDLDVAARAEAENVGLAYHRVPMPNTDPAFIAALAAVVRGASVVELRVNDVARKRANGDPLAVQ